MSNKSISEQTKEYERIRKDRDLLLDVAKRAQNTLDDYEEGKKQIDKLTKEKTGLNSIINELKAELTKFETQYNKLNNDNLELHKQNARNEEKISLLSNEKMNQDNLLKEKDKSSESDANKKLQELFERQLSEQKQKYKKKIINLKAEIEKKNKSIAEIQKENSTSKATLEQALAQQSQDFLEEKNRIIETHKKEKEKFITTTNAMMNSQKAEEKLHHIFVDILEIIGEMEGFQEFRRVFHG